MVGNHGIEHGATGVPGFVGGNRWRHASTLRTASRIRRGQDIAPTILHICAVVKKNNTGRTKQATRYAPYPPWFVLPDHASALTCRHRQRDPEALQSPGSGGSGGALPQTPEQKYRLCYLSVQFVRQGWGLRVGGVWLIGWLPPVERVA